MPDNTPMIERVARDVEAAVGKYIYWHCRYNDNDPEEAQALIKEISTNIARAAIKEMMEPDKAMIDVGVTFALNASISGDYTWADYVVGKHQTMIKAALEEKE